MTIFSIAPAEDQHVHVALVPNVPPIAKTERDGHLRGSSPRTK
jgi:hypothetical protein